MRDGKPALPEDVQLASILDHGRRGAVRRELRRLFLYHYRAADYRPVAKAFRLVVRLYTGAYPGFRECTTDYHDLYHVLEVATATARLLDGLILAGRRPSPEAAADLLIAALLHDCGYIQEAGDRAGTGAKFTRTHVDRSAAFALREAEAFGLGYERAGGIARLILGTELGRRWHDLEFRSDMEGKCAAILAAADILGQMADRAYLEKLLFLYYEFREAGIPGYDSAFEILDKTLGFYASVRQRLDTTLASTKELATLHFRKRYGIDRDLYREAIQRQMDFLATVVADDTGNFRKKLRRMDLEEVERKRRA